MITPVLRTVGLITLAMTFFVTLISEATVPALDLVKIRAGYTLLKTQNLKPFDVPPGDPITPSGETIPTLVSETFYRVQRAFFGRTDLISLKSCGGCDALSDAHTMTVNLDPHFLAKVKQEAGSEGDLLLMMTVAHEVAHFAYDYSTLNQPDGLSVNANIPLLTKSFADYTDIVSYAQMSPQSQKAMLTGYMVRASHAHAEVDVNAVMILNDLGIHAGEAARNFLKRMAKSSSSDPLIQLDFATRYKTLLALKNELP